MNKLETMEYKQLRSILMIPLSEKSHPVVSQILDFHIWVRDDIMDTIVVYDVSSSYIAKIPKRLRKELRLLEKVPDRYQGISRYIDNKIEENLRIPIKVGHYISKANESIRQSRRVMGLKGIQLDSDKEK